MYIQSERIGTSREEILKIAEEFYPELHERGAHLSKHCQIKKVQNVAVNENSVNEIKTANEIKTFLSETKNNKWPEGDDLVMGSIRLDSILWYTHFKNFQHMSFKKGTTPSQWHKQWLLSLSLAFVASLQVLHKNCNQKTYKRTGPLSAMQTGWISLRLQYKRSYNGHKSSNWEMRGI